MSYKLPCSCVVKTIHVKVVPISLTYYVRGDKEDYYADVMADDVLVTNKDIQTRLFSESNGDLIVTCPNCNKECTIKDVKDANICSSCGAERENLKTYHQHKLCDVCYDRYAK